MASIKGLDKVALYLLLPSLLYILYGVIWRLYLSPLAKYPGPRLAAITSWYEFYYDIIQPGRFPWEVQRLHDVYGPVVRITPFEIHVRDPEFFNELMTTSARPRDKTEFLNGLSGQSSVFGTVPHELHRLRRSALNNFFSKKSITAFEPKVQQLVQDLCEGIRKCGDHEVVNLSVAFTSLALDNISLYAFGRSYGLLKRPDFAPEWRSLLYNSLKSFPLVRHVPWISKFVKILPSRCRSIMNKEMAFCLNLEAETRADVVKVVENYTSGITKKVSRNSIFEELIDSDLPPQEKTVDRLNQEGFILILAGGDVSAMNLAMMSYHLLANPHVLAILLAELREAIPDLKCWPTWQELENLPFLRACIKEGLRINAVPVSRNVRVAPNETLFCDGWEIEPGTAVSMNMHFTQLDPEIFPNPTRFDPERWLDTAPLSSDQKARMERCFAPFGKGTRSCLGINLAYCELFLALANVFRRFEFELFETTIDDVTLVSNALVGHPKEESKGIRVKVKTIGES